MNTPTPANWPVVHMHCPECDHTWDACTALDGNCPACGSRHASRTRSEAFVSAPKHMSLATPQPTLLNPQP